MMIKYCHSILSNMILYWNKLIVLQQLNGYTYLLNTYQNTADEDSPLGNTRVSDLVLVGLKSSKELTDKRDDVLSNVFKLEFSRTVMIFGRCHEEEAQFLKSLRLRLSQGTLYFSCSISYSNR